jgi:hypothetical protein
MTASPGLADDDEADTAAETRFSRADTVEGCIDGGAGCSASTSDCCIQSSASIWVGNNMMLREFSLFEYTVYYIVRETSSRYTVYYTVYVPIVGGLCGDSIVKFP